MCNCVVAIFGLLYTFILWLLGIVFLGIGYLIEPFFTGIALLYGYTWVLSIHAALTYFGFIVSFALSPLWFSHINSDLYSPLVCPCDCFVTPTPPPSIDHPHLGVISAFFINIWHAYRAAILETGFYFAAVLYALAMIILVCHWKKPDSLVRLKQAFAPFNTVGQLYKSLIEISILRLIVLIGDVFCDPKQVDFPIFLTFVFAYLHFASIFKLIGVGSDFGWLDGLASVVLAAFEHFVRPWSWMQLVGILLTTIVICYKNAMWTGHGTRRQPEGVQHEGIEFTQTSTHA